MTRTMFDGANPDTVPAGAPIYAGYINGDYQSYWALVAKYPSALHVSISVTASQGALVLDIENGDATPAQAPGWATKARAAGVEPVCYMNASTWPAVKAAFAAQKVTPPLYWVALYVTGPDNVPDIPDGALAIQYYDHGGYDVSSVANYWPGLDPAPTPAAIAAPQKEDDEMSTTSVNGRAGLAWAAGQRHVLEANYAAAGQSDLVLQVELKLTTGPVYSSGWTIDHATGTGVFEIPEQYIASCRGVILTGPASLVYDATAV